MLSTAHPCHVDDNDDDMLMMVMMTMTVSSGDVSSSVQLAVRPLYVSAESDVNQSI